MPKPITELLAKGRCPVRLKLSPPAPSPAVEAWLAQNKWRRLQPLRISRCDKKGKRIRMRHTCWLWCYDCEAWRNPDRFVSPSEYADGERAEPRCVHVGEVPKTPPPPAAPWSSMSTPQRARDPCPAPPRSPPPPPLPDDDVRDPNDDDPYARWVRNPWQSYLASKDLASKDLQLAKLAANWVAS